MAFLRESLLTAFALCAIGCQTYQPLAVDLERHHQELVRRGLGSPTVQAFAEKLASLNPGRPARIDPTDGLGLREAEALALLFNPDLAVTRAEARVASSRAGLAGLWDDPELSLDLLRLLQAAESPWVLATSLQVTIPISGRLGLAREKARLEARVALRRLQQQEWQTVRKLREAWVRWSMGIEQITLTEDHLTRVTAVQKLAAVQRRFGKIGTTAARVFEIERMTQLGNRAQSAQALRQEELTIRSLLGLLPERKQALLPGLPPGRELEGDLSRRLRGTNHALRLARARLDVADAAYRLELRKQYPDLTIGPGFEREDGAEKLGVVLSLPIPLLNRNRQGIAEAHAERLLAKANLEATYQKLVVALASGRAAFAASRDRRKFLETRLAPLIDRQQLELRNLAKLGDLDVLVMLDALDRTYQVKQQILQARLDEALARIQLEALIGSLRTPPTRDDGRTP